MSTDPPETSRQKALSFLGTAPVCQAIATAALYAFVLFKPTVAMIGWAGHIAIVTSLVAVAALSMWGRRDRVEIRGMLPVSFLIFVGWVVVSIVWANHTLATVEGIFYFVCTLFLGGYIALCRDLGQIVRAVADVARVTLTLSVIFEILSGILLNVPIPFLGIQGNLDEAGPIQGVVGDRNTLGTIAIIGVISFLVEWSTHAVDRNLSRYSFVLAALVLVFTRSPVVAGLAAAITIAWFALLLVRRAGPDAKRAWNPAMVVIAVVLGVGAVLARSVLLDLFNGHREYSLRISLWREILGSIFQRPLQGFGFVGYWHPSLDPYSGLNDIAYHVQTTALSAYVDLVLQVGVIGLLLFLFAVVLAFARSWSEASAKRSLSYAWLPIVLLTVLLASLADSYAIEGWGLLLLTVCCVKTSEFLPWRPILEPEIIRSS